MHQNTCHHCGGKGYIEIRDCAGEVQREETCSFCGGLGYIEEEEEGKSDRALRASEADRAFNKKLEPSNLNL